MEDSSVDRREDRMAGVSLASAAVLLVAILSQQPESRVTDAALRLTELRMLTAGSGAVYAVMLALIAVLLHGLLGLARGLGPRSTRVRVGLIAWGSSLWFLAAVAVSTGFIIPELARVYVGAPAEAYRTFTEFVFLFRASNIAFFKLSLAAGSVGMTAWSLSLFGRNAMTTPLAIVGVALSIVPPLGLIAGAIHLDATGRLVFLGLQATWLVWCGTLLYTGRLERQAAASASGAMGAA